MKGKESVGEQKTGQGKGGESAVAGDGLGGCFSTWYRFWLTLLSSGEYLLALMLQVSFQKECAEIGERVHLITEADIARMKLDAV